MPAAFAEVVSKKGYPPSRLILRDGEKKIEFGARSPCDPGYGHVSKGIKAFEQAMRDERARTETGSADYERIMTIWNIREMRGISES